MAGKGVLRSLKNFTKGFSDVQIKVREATSNDAWCPSGSLMNEIAMLTYNKHDFIEVMDMIDKRLNDKGKNWRHVFKALLLLDYCLHVGSENVVLYAKENAYLVKTLKEFQHVEENGKDVGANVRQKANDIVNLLQDDDRLRDERRRRRRVRDRMTGAGDYTGKMTSMQGSGCRTNRGDSDDDWELKKATEESKRLAEEEERKRRQGEEEDIAIALQLSEQEAKDREERLKHQPCIDADFSTIFNPYSQLRQSQQHQQIDWISKCDGLLDISNNTAQNNGNHQSTNNPYIQQQQIFQQSQLTDITGSLSFNQRSQAPFGQLDFAFDGVQKHQQQSLNKNIAAIQLPLVTGSKQQSPKTSNVSTDFMQNSITASSSPFDAIKPTPISPIGARSSDISAPPSPPFAIAFFTAGQSRPYNGKSNEDPRYENLNTLLGLKDDGIYTFGNIEARRIPFSIGYANTIKSHEYGNSINTTGSAAQGYDTACKLPSFGPNTVDQAPQQQSNGCNPFNTTGNNLAGII